MSTLTLKYSRANKAFNLVGTSMFFGPADPDEFDNVADWLSRCLCDNPAMQAEMGVLGEDVFMIERG